VIRYLPSNHVDVLKMFIVLAGLDDEDFDIGIFSKTCSNNTSGCTATVIERVSKLLVTHGSDMGQAYPQTIKSYVVSGTAMLPFCVYSIV
jgi:hypothetical protein